MEEQDIYVKLFIKMAYVGFPDEFKGYKMIYYFRDYQAELCYNGTVTNKIRKMWEVYAK